MALSRDSKEKGIAEMLVDLVKVDVDALGQEEDLVTGGPGPGEEDNGDFATPGRQLRPDDAFSVEQLDDRKEQRSALITLIIGSVDVPDVLDSGASCNQTPTSYNPVT